MTTTPSAQVLRSVLPGCFHQGPPPWLLEGLCDDSSPAVIEVYIVVGLCDESSPSVVVMSIVVEVGDIPGSGPVNRGQESEVREEDSSCLAAPWPKLHPLLR